MLPEPPIVPRKEQDRLTALRNLQILDTTPELAFDQITRLAALTLGVETAAVSLIDTDRQWFKSRNNLELLETPRDEAVCEHTIRAGKVFVVPDPEGRSALRQ